MRRAAVASAALLVASCAQPLSDLSGTIPTSPAEPVCFWNAAYVEHGEPDAVSDVLARARGCHVLLDPFDSEAARDAIAALHDADNTVVCYVSVGTCEDWRDDFDDVAPFCTDREWGSWPGEFFVDDPAGIGPRMLDRFAHAAAWGCDLVEMDNMDFASEADRYGLDVTEAEADDYVRSLCDGARDLGLGCMAKNGRPGGDDGFFAGTFESFPDDLDWWAHDTLQSFVDAGQPATVVHYREQRCEDVTRFYRLRYGSGVSVLCSRDDGRGYAH